MAKVVCESCETSFKYEVIKDLKSCPVCGKPLWESKNSVEDSVHDEVEELDFKHPDMYFYSIEDEEDEEDINFRYVWCDCTSCGKINTIPCSKFDFISEDYVKLKKDLHLKCEGCGKEIMNLTIPERPEEWLGFELREKEYDHIPKCPTCGSTKIKKISATSKAASVAVWGVLSRKVHKQWHCNTCGSEW